MSDNFSFEEQRINLSAYGTPTGLVGFLIKKLHVRDEKTANLILVIVAIIIFAISGYIFAGALGA